MGCQRVMYSCPKAFILKGLRVQAIGFTRNSCLLHLLSEWSDESNESSGVEINCHKIFWWVSEGGICGHIFARQIQKFIQTKKKGGGLLKLLRWCVLIVYDLLFWMTVPRFRDRQKQPLWACLLFEKTAAFWNWDLGRGRSFTTSSRTCSDQDNVRCIATWCDGASLHAPVWSILRWATSQQGSNKTASQKARDPNHRILKPTVLTVCHLCFSLHEAHVSHETMEIDPGSLNMDLLELRNGIHSKITRFFVNRSDPDPPVWFGGFLVSSRYLAKEQS